ncbi:MAG: 16S rRNA processing protein RimM [Clostridia bacterium]|nr:16S rRNA processing protein RimM [Clostridia bacterium]
MKHEYLECGKIINKRGIGGELKVDCYCDSPSSVFGAKVMYTDKAGKESFDVVSVKEYKGFLYIKLKGVDSAEAADSMRNRLLYISRDEIELSDGKNFIADLIGLDVIDSETGKVYGKIKDIVNFGASDIYVISDGSTEYMLPAVEGVIVETNIDSHVLIKPIPGIFDEAEEIR